MDGLKARKTFIELLGQVGLDEKSDFYVDGLFQRNETETMSCQGT